MLPLVRWFSESWTYFNSSLLLRVQGDHPPGGVQGQSPWWGSGQSPAGLDHRFVHMADDPDRLDAHPTGKTYKILSPPSWSGRTGPNDDQGRPAGQNDDQCQLIQRRQMPDSN